MSTVLNARTMMQKTIIQIEDAEMKHAVCSTITAKKRHKESRVIA